MAPTALPLISQPGPTLGLAVFASLLLVLCTHRALPTSVPSFSMQSTHSGISVFLPLVHIPKSLRVQLRPHVLWGSFHPAAFIQETLVKSSVQMELTAWLSPATPVHP